MFIKFCGAAQSVTGSRHLITTNLGTHILLDCGLFQGYASAIGQLNHTFNFDATKVDYLILSHAHIDHSGALPRLVKLGFRGPIYCTPPTLDLCRIMLADSAHIQQNDLKYVNQRRKKHNEPPLDPLYDMDDVDLTLSLMKAVDYHEVVNIKDEVFFHFTDAAHIIGSAAVHLDIIDHNRTVKLSFTGDIGRPNDQILNQPETFRQADIIICESTYGNRLHEEYAGQEERLRQIVTDTCVKRRGRLIIPAFSIDRTQELIYTLDRMAHEGKMPPVKVYVDSPLSVKATDIMRKHSAYFNPSILKYMENDNEHDAFSFRNLHYITQVEDSKAINNSKEPCIIISASGMAEAGRIKHHISNNIENASNTIMIVGYCTPESLGGRLRNGDKIVKIFGDDYHVKAHVEILDGYSAHGDYNEMIQFLKCQNPGLVRKLILVHGELEVQQDFKEKLKNEGYTNVLIPSLGEEIKI
jgi:metallo-beta-lactamase family protein